MYFQACWIISSFQVILIEYFLLANYNKTWIELHNYEDPFFCAKTLAAEKGRRREAKVLVSHKQDDD